MHRPPAKLEQLPCQDGQSQRPSWQGERFDAHADCEEEETTDCSAVGLNDEPRPA